MLKSAAIVCLLPAAAAAQATIPGTALQGSGFQPCQQVLEWDERGVDLQFIEEWFLGFWTAENIARVQRGEAPADLSVDAVGPGEVEALIVQRCAAEPEARVFNVMQDLAASLPRAQTSGN